MIKSPNLLENHLLLLDKNIEFIKFLREELQKSLTLAVKKKLGYLALKDLELIESINLLIAMFPPWNFGGISI